jgi:uncharacterized protein YbjT (DUF2867 family)
VEETDRDKIGSRLMTEPRTILVTGATGRVGRHVVAGLREAAVTVRALVRNPLLAGLPSDVEIVTGDISDPDAVQKAAAGVDAAFLLWPSFSAEGAAPVVEALAKQVSRVVYLSSMNVRDDQPPSASGVWGELEHLVAQAGVDWTFLRPGGFAVNTQGWAEEFRTGHVIRMPFPGAARSLIHERDIAAVAVLALLDDKHIGQKYQLTGPESLTQEEQARIIGGAAGKAVRIEEQSAAEARQAMLEIGADPILAESSVNYWSALVDNPEPVTNTVEALTGRPARTFREWAADHADDFRIRSTTEVAQR